jgi:hypothetical protein
VDPTKRFLEFTTAFEQTFVEDDWARFEPYLVADAIYAVTVEAPLGAMPAPLLDDVAPRVLRAFAVAQADVVG